MSDWQEAEQIGCIFKDKEKKNLRPVPWSKRNKISVKPNKKTQKMKWKWKYNQKNKKTLDSSKGGQIKRAMAWWQK